MKAGVVLLDDHMDKRMGCMAGLFQIFDRHQFLSRKRLPPPTGNASPSPSPSDTSPSPLSPSAKRPSPACDFKDYSCASQTPRDIPSCAGSPSVVARLMGLDALPSSADTGAELRRSASEPRTSHDLPSNEKSKPLKAKSFFDAQDFFPEKAKLPPRGSLYGEIERKLRNRGIPDEPTKDLETLRQILEALQLKGLLHSHHNGRNIIVEDTRSRSSVSPSPPHCRSPAVDSRTRTGNPRQARKTPRALDSAELKSPVSAGRLRGDRRVSPPKPQRSVGTVPRRAAPVSPRTRRVQGAPELESMKMGEAYSAGRSLLERCDKLLHSIAEITERGGVAEPQQPSPVSVLESSDSFYSDEVASAAASPLSVDSKETVELHRWMPSPEPVKLLHPQDEVEAADPDFCYVARILGSGELGRVGDEEVFVSLEKEREGSGDASYRLITHRRLVFDVITEMVDKQSNVSSWEAFLRSRLFASTQPATSARKLWDELKRIRDEIPANDHFVSVRNAIYKDVACSLETCGSGWQPVDMSDSVLDIERLIFKDLISETIRDLASCISSRLSGGKCRVAASAIPRRKLVF